MPSDLGSVVTFSHHLFGKTVSTQREKSLRLVSLFVIRFGAVL